ncbi:MAG TPA: hypothetical protein VHY57_09385, partial [Rhizomicrobium sp.]|nr:hypothetical protein [Rhizomicrobium sp.]
LFAVAAISTLAIARVIYCLVKKAPRLIAEPDAQELKYALPIVAIAALFYLGLMWLPRVMGAPMEVMATHRPVTWMLPIDNVLQENIARVMYAGASPKVTDFRDWSSSDRPPLEAGVQLFSMPLLCGVFGVPWNVNTQLSGMALQLIWVFGVWALVRALGCSPRAASQITLCLMPTPLLYINSIFIWAKLSAAAYAIGATAILCLRGKRPLGIAESATAGALMALAILSHSGIAFYLLPLCGLWLIWPRPIGRPGWRTVLVMAAVAAPMLIAWTCYQKFGDPPGNHLLKLNFAGAIDSDDRPLWQTLRAAYGSLTWRQILSNKAANIATLFKGDWPSLFTPFAGDRPHRRVDNFYFLFRSCGIWLLGLPALAFLLLRRKFEQRGPLLFLLASLGGSISLWCLLMFGAGAQVTVVHQGAYGVPLVLLVLLAFALRRLHPIALLIVGLYNLVQFLWIYASPAPYPPVLDWLAIAVLVIAAILTLGLLRGTPLVRLRRNNRLGRPRSPGILFCLLLIIAGNVAAAPVGSNGSDSDKPMVPCVAQGDFWIDGQPPDLPEPADLAEAHRGGNLVLWGSWCDGNPNRVGMLILGP